MAEKSKANALKEELFYTPKHMATVAEDDLFPKADVFAEGYKDFMSNYKTEREITAFFQAEAEKRGYTEFDKTKTYKPGDRVYRVNRNKCIILTVFGKKPLTEGLRIAASHIDSPRLDLKPNPLYEKEELAFFKTHYYGGIKKYQWTTIPLSLHGVIVKGDGTTVTVNIG
ncbi:MAG: aminopeptidase, partial [Clostridia bacterium]|nr:aminopeptidase [Clostridia bacterium]